MLNNARWRFSMKAKMQPEEVMPALRARGLFPEIMARLRIKRQAVESWRVVPADRVVIIAQLSGIAPNIIRPDVFPDAAGNTRPLDGYRTLAMQRKSNGAKRVRPANRRA
jgi:hypothetical protein